MKSLHWILTGAVLIGGAGCSTSGDPHEGGLFGYWASGESGYERRAEERRQSIGQVEQQTEAERTQSQGLENQRNSLRNDIRRQQAALEALDEELAGLQAQCDELQSGNARQEAERQKLLKEMATAQSQLTTVRGDSTSALAEKQKKIAALQAELKILRERASLLTTL